MPVISARGISLPFVKVSLQESFEYGQTFTDGDALLSRRLVRGRFMLASALPAKEAAFGIAAAGSHHAVAGLGSRVQRPDETHQVSR